MVLYAIPFISAAIGWFTNYVAIKMLFYPRVEKDLYLFKLQGIFPKRKHVLAERLGRAVERDLFSIEMIKTKLDNEANREKLKEAIIVELETYLLTRFKEANPMVAMLLNDKMVAQIKERIANMLEELVPKLMGQMTNKLDEVDVQAMVFEKVNNFSHEKLEALLMSVIKKELRFIELAGAVLGFLIGLLQVGMVSISNNYDI